MSVFRTTLLVFSFCFVIVGAVPEPVFAQRDLKDIPVPDPELERATFRLPEGFEVNLFAADPMIAKPIQMNFDEDGKLWIVSSEVYPQIAPGKEATDRVLVLEDQNQDGVSDATHVFAGGLLIPTGVAPGDGGVYVANSTELLHFADTDGDLKADSNVLCCPGSVQRTRTIFCIRCGGVTMAIFTSISRSTFTVISKRPGVSGD